MKEIKFEVKIMFTFNCNIFMMMLGSNIFSYKLISLNLVIRYLFGEGMSMQYVVNRVPSLLIPQTIGYPRRLFTKSLYVDLIWLPNLTKSDSIAELHFVGLNSDTSNTHFTLITREKRVKSGLYVFNPELVSSALAL